MNTKGEEKIFIDGDFNNSYASRLMRIEREQKPKNKKYRTKMMTEAKPITGFYIEKVELIDHVETEKEAKEIVNKLRASNDDDCAYTYSNAGVDESQNEMWIQAIELFNKKEHTQDGRDLVMKNFTIKRA